MTGPSTLEWQRNDRVPLQTRRMDNLDPLLSAQQLADYLGVPVATIYTWRYRREGPPGFRAGKHLRYRRHDVERWIVGRLGEHTG